MELNKENPSKSAKPPSPSGCKINIHPQQQEFQFNELTLDSCFDSGNMANAVRVTESQYQIWIAPDCAGTPRETTYQTWFYFRAKDIKRHSTYTFTIKNMNFQMKLYNEGLLPVYKTSSNPVWKKIEAKTLSFSKQEKGLEVSFRYHFNPNDEEVFFAFTYPWSYTEDQELINQYEREYKDDSEIYFNRELLAYSKENRRIELLTITSHSKKLEQREPMLPNLFPGSTNTSRPFLFNKKYVFITARVHPGETPGSHVFRGLLKFILNKEDPRAQALLENFVMVLIPMLNPDGVYRGHYRADTNGLNLNRYYTNPSLSEHPTIYATKQMVVHLNSTKKLYLYCDLHAHATKRGCFVYGNSLDFRQQVETLLFPKLLSLNSQYFEYESCDFNEKNVNVKDRGDGKSKEGAGRVALYKATELAKCYTLECNYASGKYKNVLSSCHLSGSSQEEEKELAEGETPDNLTVEKANPRDSYYIEDFEEIGEGIGPTLLDMIKANPSSRIPTSTYRNLKNVKLNLALNLFKEPPYRFDVYLRKLNKNITKNYDTLIKYIDENIKTDPLQDGRKENNRQRVSRTVPPQIKKRPLNESRETTATPVPPTEVRGLKEIKVINILPPIRTSGALESINEKRKQRPTKPMLTKKPTITLPPKNGFNFVKRMMKG